MTLRRIEGGWRVDAQPGGRGGRRYRKTLKTQAEAKAYYAWLTTQVTQNAKWQPVKRDTRKLSELVELWYAHHGSGLRAGANTYSRMKLACGAMGDPSADRFTVNTFASYRAERLAAGILPNSINREHAYLRSMFNELRRLGQWKGENPLADLRQFKVQERELSYLTLEQVTHLMTVLADGRNRHAAMIAKVCLATGSRWSEAENLEERHVRNGQKARCARITTRQRPAPGCSPTRIRRFGRASSVRAWPSEMASSPTCYAIRSHHTS